MRWLKKIALLTGGLLLLLLAVLVVYTSLRQEKITAALTRKVNEAVNTKISYGNLRLTVLSSFPNIGARFDNLLVAPSPYYDRTQFAGDNTDTLLYASSLSLKISLPSLLTGTIAVKAITVSDGEISMLTDKRGDINFEVLAGRKGGGKNVRLKNISAKNITVIWHDRSSEMRIAGTSVRLPSEERYSELVSSSMPPSAPQLIPPPSGGWISTTCRRPPASGCASRPTHSQ